MLAIDWGTSSLRVYRLDADGKVADLRSSADGILRVKDGAFAAALERTAGDWLANDDTGIIMSGMIGSRQGWIEADYVACPAGLAEVASAMCSVQWTAADGRRHRARIAPGLRCQDEAGVADVMRGEEVQILGTLEQLGTGEHIVCLPGTHSKWALVRAQSIVSFSTYMTGEVFAVLKQHSILGRTMRHDGTGSEEFDRAAFADGVARSADAGGLLHHLFGVRAQVLSGAISEQHTAAYLSGIVIGHELRAATQHLEQFHLVGDTALTELYSLAASEIGKHTRIHNTGAAPRGLFALAKYAEAKS